MAPGKRKGKMEMKEHRKKQLARFLSERGDEHEGVEGRLSLAALEILRATLQAFQSFPGFEKPLGMNSTQHLRKLCEDFRALSAKSGWVPLPITAAELETLLG